MMKLAGLKVDQNTYLQAMMVDALNWLVWSKTKDGSKNVNKPKSIVEALQYGKEETKKFDVFDSVEEFKKAREEALKEKYG